MDWMKMDLEYAHADTRMAYAEGEAPRRVAQKRTHSVLREIALAKKTLKRRDRHSAAAEIRAEMEGVWA